MPYKDKYKDRLWHKNHMRTKRKLIKLLNPTNFTNFTPESGVVTPSTLRLE